MRKFLILLLLVLAGHAHAALLDVTGEYVVTEQVRERERLGIALRDADNGGRTQNWLWVNEDTKVCVRYNMGNGTFRDEVFYGDDAWRLLPPGTQFKVHAGRDWDGTLTAYKIWTAK